MTKKFEKTKYTSIFKYKTTKGIRYRVRFSCQRQVELNS